MTLSMAPAIAVADSDNSKIGRASATYAAQATCPTTCPLLNNGCYAEDGYVAFTTKRLAGNVRQETPEELAQAEADAVDQLPGTRPLRLHVVGDCTTDAGARILAAAAARYTAKHGQVVWTYTHAWRQIKRKSWGGIKVRASVESVSEAAEAKRRGYPVMLVVAEHLGAWAYPTEAGKTIPCVNQTRGATCTDCKLCWTSDETIAIAAHGRAVKKVRGVVARGAVLSAS